MSAASAEREFILDIEGMTCASCVGHVEQALKDHPSVSEARVSLASRTAAVRSGLEDPAPLIALVDQAGYKARSHEAAAPPADEAKGLMLRLAISAFFSFDVIAFSLVVAPGTRSSMFAAWLFATPVMFYGGWPFLRAATRAMRTRVYTMDTLVAAGSLAAYGYSVAAVLGGGHHAFFDTASMIITLILLGRTLEVKARGRASNAARSLLQRIPQTATVIDGGEERKVPAADLRVGQMVAVLPGESIPADGTVRSGESTIDLSMLTGESAPIDVVPGDHVVGAALNGYGRIEIELTHVGEETRLAGIVRLLEVTQASKAPIQRLADRVAKAFVPRVMWLAAAAFFLSWYLAAHSLGEALMRAAAVLLVACPCSLGLATPIAIVSGSGRAAELGILFKGGEVFEAARRIDTVLIDKTGTLTEGQMSLSTIVGIGASEADVLALAAAVERGSEHPLARSVLRGATERAVEIPEASGHRAVPGAGVTARIGSHLVRVGRPNDLPTEAAARTEELAARGETVFAVWRDDDVIGLVGATDAVKEEAADVVSRLQRRGYDVALVSGDRRAAVEAAALEAGITRAVAEVFPEGKVEEVKRLQAMGRRVAFVGDGVNDAPALAQADLGIAIGTGTDVAKEAGRVLIMGSDLRSVSECLELARKTFWVIAQNLTWAFAYNVSMIPLAAAGRVSPLVAAGAMAGSSVTVVGNALRLRRFAPPRTQNPAEVCELVAAVPEAAVVPERVVAERPPRRSELAPEAAHRTEPITSLPIGTFAKEESRRILGLLSGLLAKSWDY